MTDAPLPSRRNSNVEYAGPWASAETAADYLGITGAELEAMRQRRDALGCTFADQQTYYPVRQFASEKVVAGLGEVLDVLLGALPSERVASTWLAGPADDGTGRTVWEQLADGDLGSVLGVAQRETARWNA
jgi:hypothetical protein